MKQRILSSLIGLMLLAVVYAFLHTPVLNVVIAGICLMAAYELLNATGCAKHRGLLVLTMVLSVVIAFARVRWLWPVLSLALFAIVLLYFALLLHGHKTMKLEHLAMSFFFGTVVPLFFSCAVFLRDDHGSLLGGFYLIVALGSAWLCDTGAYFVGSAFGKHKLAPEISPKKTVEGAIGGLTLGTLFMLLVAFGYSWGLSLMGLELQVNYLALGLLTPVFALAGMMGDLSASVIKRQYHVKDFGNIMPGHGGVLDRFDSVLFTLPTVYVTVRWVALAQVAGV